MDWMLMVLGIIGVVLQYSTRLKNENEKGRFVVYSQYIVMVLVIVLGAYSQYDSSKKETLRSNATYEISVLSKVSEKYIEVIELAAKLSNSTLTVKHYLSYEEAKRSNPDLAPAIDWFKDASDTQRRDLESAKNGLSTLNTIAADIIRIDMESNGVIPVETLAWAKETATIKLADFLMYFDAYAPPGEMPKDSVLQYHNEMGNAFGVVIGRLKHAANVLQAE